MDKHPTATLTASLIRILSAIVLLIGAITAQAQVTLTQGTNFSVDVAQDGRLAIDLLGKIWIVPPTGGQAREIGTDLLTARGPRWSPDLTSIVYQARAGNQHQLWLYRFDADATDNISDGQFFDQHPQWHPDGERIVYSSDRRDTGFDLWELDLETSLTWRISSTTGDETEPAWSSDGDDLVYIHHYDEQWSLVLRRKGQPDRILETSSTRLSAPSWRPDGSLVTLLRHSDDGLSIDMVILSDPPLIRSLISGEDIFVAPVTWLDRHQMLYAADGVIRTRLFNSWSSSTIPFRATLRREERQTSVRPKARELPHTNAPEGQLVIRTARLFDGIGGGYREDLDIIIDGDEIVAVEAQRERPGAIIVDMGDLTTLPGFIDGHASLPEDLDESLGPVLLSYGITTIVASHANADALNQRWSGQEMPGPRVLGEGWQLDPDSASVTMLGTGPLPVSPQGVRYENIQLSNGAEPLTIVSGLADARTRDLRPLLRSRQAGLLGNYPTAIRRFSEKPRLATGSSAIVLGSKSNGFPPGIASHAEFRALAEAGLNQEQVLRAAGINAASALGLGLQLGRIAPGSSADLVLVDGDPLANINDTQKIVGVVRNGRFYSAIGLIERAEQRHTVE